MKKYLNKIKINNYTYLFILISFLCGYIKNTIIIFIICIIHELGHILFIKLFKYNIEYIELFFYGGYTIINKKINTNINKDIIIAFGGVFIQIIFLLIIYIYKNNFNIITYNLIYKYNIIIIIFNLLPIIPLDGNNIIHLLLEKYFSYHLSYYLNVIISIFFLIIFIIINYIYNIDNYYIVIFLIYQLFIYIKNYKYLRNRFLLERYLYDLEYKRIDNNTKSINDLKKEVLHYFKYNNKYIKEGIVIKNEFDKHSNI